ncbi:MAG: hypothetical protein LBR39_02505, partial [Coriobacteriales bacterium]|nr:hypothetical protein [Coriobacteriales bacterium]
MSSSDLEYMPELDVDDSPEPKPEPRGRRILREILEIVVIICVAIALTTLLRLFVIDQYVIPTGS